MVDSFVGIVPRDNATTNLNVMRSTTTTSLQTQLLRLPNGASVTGPSVRSRAYAFRFPSGLPETGQRLAALDISNGVITTGWADAGNVLFSEGVIVVGKGQTQPGLFFNSLTDAVAYVNTQTPSESRPFGIRIDPGTYEEPTTVVLPPYVGVYSSTQELVTLSTSDESPVLHIGDFNSVAGVTLAGIIVSPLSDTACVRNCTLVASSYVTGSSFACLETCQVLSCDLSVSASSSSAALEATLFGCLIQGGTLSVSGSQTTLVGQSNLYQETDLALLVTNGANVSLNADSFTESVSVGIRVGAGGSPNLTLCSASFEEGVTTQVNIANSATTGVGLGLLDITKVFIPEGCAWYIYGRPRYIVTVGPSLAADFQSIVDAIDYVSNTAIPSPSALTPYAIQVRPGNYAVDTTIVLPDFVDIIGSPQTVLYMTVANTTCMQVGYPCEVSALIIYGYGTDIVNPTFDALTGNTAGYGILFTGTDRNIEALQSTVLNVTMGNIWRCIGILTNPGLSSRVHVQGLIYDGYKNMEYGIYVDAGLGVKTVTYVADVQFTPTLSGTAGLFQGFAYVTGANPSTDNLITFENCTLESTPTAAEKFGIAFDLPQGDVLIKNTSIEYYDTAISIPTGAETSATMFAMNIHRVNTSFDIQAYSSQGTFQGIASLNIATIVSPSFAITATDPDGSGTYTVGSIFNDPRRLLLQAQKRLPTFHNK